MTTFSNKDFASILNKNKIQNQFVLFTEAIFDFPKNRMKRKTQLPFVQTTFQITTYKIKKYFDIQ